MSSTSNNNNNNNNEHERSSSAHGESSSHNESGSGGALVRTSGKTRASAQSSHRSSAALVSVTAGTTGATPASSSSLHSNATTGGGGGGGCTTASIADPNDEIWLQFLSSLNAPATQPTCASVSAKAGADYVAAAPHNNNNNDDDPLGLNMSHTYPVANSANSLLNSMNDHDDENDDPDFTIGLDSYDLDDVDYGDEWFQVPKKEAAALVRDAMEFYENVPDVSSLASSIGIVGDATASCCSSASSSTAHDHHRAKSKFPRKLTNELLNSHSFCRTPASSTSTTTTTAAAAATSTTLCAASQEAQKTTPGDATRSAALAAAEAHTCNITGSDKSTTDQEPVAATSDSALIRQTNSVTTNNGETTATATTTMNTATTTTVAASSSSTTTNTTITADYIPVFDDSQRKQLDEQLRNYVQLVTQTCVVSLNSLEYKRVFEEASGLLDALAALANNKSLMAAHFEIVNLSEARLIVADLQRSQADTEANKEQNNNNTGTAATATAAAADEDDTHNAGAAQRRSVSTLRDSLAGDRANCISSRLLELMLSSRVFYNTNLLPNCKYRYQSHYKRAQFSDTEKILLIMGFNKFKHLPKAECCQCIREHLLPQRACDDIRKQLCHIANSEQRQLQLRDMLRRQRALAANLLHNYEFATAVHYKSPFEQAEFVQLPPMYTMVVERLRMSNMLKDARQHLKEISDKSGNNKTKESSSNSSKSACVQRGDSVSMTADVSSTAHEIEPFDADTTITAADSENVVDEPNEGADASQNITNCSATKRPSNQQKQQQQKQAQQQQDQHELGGPNAKEKARAPPLMRQQEAKKKKQQKSQQQPLCVSGADSGNNKQQVDRARATLKRTRVQRSGSASSSSSPPTLIVLSPPTQQPLSASASSASSTSTSTSTSFSLRSTSSPLVTPIKAAGCVGPSLSSLSSSLLFSANKSVRDHQHRSPSLFNSPSSHASPAITMMPMSSSSSGSISGSGVNPILIDGNQQQLIQLSTLLGGSINTNASGSNSSISSSHMLPSFALPVDFFQQLSNQSRMTQQQQQQATPLQSAHPIQMQEQHQQQQTQMQPPFVIPANFTGTILYQPTIHIHSAPPVSSNSNSVRSVGVGSSSSSESGNKKFRQIVPKGAKLAAAKPGAGSKNK